MCKNVLNIVIICIASEKATTQLQDTIKTPYSSLQLYHDYSGMLDLLL